MQYLKPLCKWVWAQFLDVKHRLCWEDQLLHVKHIHRLDEQFTVTTGISVRLDMFLLYPFQNIFLMCVFGIFVLCDHPTLKKLSQMFRNNPWTTKALANHVKMLELQSLCQWRSEFIITMDSEGVTEKEPPAPKSPPIKTEICKTDTF